MTDIFYRTIQFTRALRPKISTSEIVYINSLLNTQQARLFFNLPLYEQRHALNVCQTLVGGGFGNDQELLQAALLHDLGKTDHTNGRCIPIWGKVANVTLKKIGGKGLVKKLASSNPQSWRYIFYLQCRHEKLGAKLALQAGSSKRVIALMSNCKMLLRNQDRAAAALKWADDIN